MTLNLKQGGIYVIHLIKQGGDLNNISFRSLSNRGFVFLCQAQLNMANKKVVLLLLRCC